MKKPVIFFCGSIIVLSSLFLFLNEAKPDNAEGKPLTIENTWELPDVLREISGLAYLEDDLFACIQDEDGIIYIYNTANSEIEKEIPFGNAGDYEGLALYKNTAYVVRSDGKIFEIQNLLSEKQEVKSYQTFFSEDNNIEGIGTDAAHNRLLLTVKDHDPTSNTFKGIYAFDLESKKLSEKPVFTVKFDDPAFDRDKDQGSDKVIRPSDIEIDPHSGKLYITDGKTSKILTIDKQGTLKQVYQLDKKALQQPEGITIAKDGAIYVSSEGKKGPGKIVKVSGLD